MKLNELLDPIEVYRLPADRRPPLLDSFKSPVIGVATNYLQKSFDNLLLTDAELERRVREMRKMNLQAVVFGGWARDRLIEVIHECETPSRDIDFVAHGDVSVLDALPNTAIKNPFGGFGVEAENIHVDIWNLRDTFLIRRNRLPVLFEQLPLTADYTANAVIFKPSQFFSDPQLVEAGAVNSILKQELDFAADDVAQPKVQAARAIILSARLNFRLSSTVRGFLKIVLATPQARETVLNGIRTYCPASFLVNALKLLSEIEHEGN
jgi:hypothetical protein